MKTCYVVMRNTPSIGDDGYHVACRVEALTDNLYLAEKVILNYYTENFGEDGGSLVCSIQPKITNRRMYQMKSHYNEEEMCATYFTVYEEEIKDDSAFL